MKPHHPLTKFISCVLIGLIVTLPFQVVEAADITPGWTFGNSDQVTAAKLNALGAGTIKTSWLTGMSALSVDPDTADLLLLYDTSAAGYRRITVGTALYNNSTLGAAVAATAGASNVIWQVTTALVGITNYANMAVPDISNTLPMWDYLSGQQKQLSLSNAWHVLNSQPYTNLPSVTTISNLTGFEFATSRAGSNQMLSVQGLMTNLAYMNSTSMTFTAQATITSNLPSGSGRLIFAAHGWSNTPTRLRCVVVCTNVAGDAATLHVFGDEVDAASVLEVPANTPAIQFGANATNVFVITPGLCGALQARIKTSATVFPYATMKSNCWVVKIYASP